MKNRNPLLAGTALGLGLAFFCGRSASAQTPKDRIIRIAELEIDPAHLEEYKALLREEIEASIRVEPGVLVLYSVQVKEHPEKVRLFEMYANREAYESHLQTPHFKKYKAGTAQMVKSLTLLDTEPILLGSKFK